MTNSVNETIEPDGATYCLCVSTRGGPADEGYGKLYVAEDTVPEVKSGPLDCLIVGLVGLA